MAKRFTKLLATTLLLPLLSTIAHATTPPDSLPYPIVDTGQKQIFSADHQLLQAPQPGQPYYGQDAFYDGFTPAYRDNGDGTITDLNTRLMWVQARGQKVIWQEAMSGAARCRVGGHTDWRMPTIKELYSLIDFNGHSFMTASTSRPYLDTRYFQFAYGDTSAGERLIDCQDWTATPYLSTTMNGNATIFGVNFADGRIKGYPRDRGAHGGLHTLYIRYVRGNPDYGKNDFHDNADGTITDRATSLMWSRDDSKTGMDWPSALAWAQVKNRQHYLGHSDWRLPNAKELQSIVDYTRCPSVTHSPAIDPIFHTTRLADGEYPFFWTSTTHLDGPPDRIGQAAVYLAFGRALGYMQFPPGQGSLQLMDVHGAGAQRSDPKTGNPNDFPKGRGPQGDVIRINDFVRLVRNVDPTSIRLVQPDLTPIPLPQRPSTPPAMWNSQDMPFFPPPQGWPPPRQ